MFNRMILSSLALAGLTGLSALSMSMMPEHPATAAMPQKSAAAAPVSVKSVIEGQPEVQFVSYQPRMEKLSLLTPIVQVETTKSPAPVKPAKKETKKTAPTVHRPAVAAQHVVYHPVQRPARSYTAPASSTTSNTDLYWLSHIIHAEAAGQPMNAQIAVGDVVLNRVRSGQYPNTVKGVIFQVANGHYQFTPVLNGWIYTQPDAASIQAAQKALQGVNLVPNALVYYTPSKTPANSWVRKQPTITSIGDFIFAK